MSIRAGVIRAVALQQVDNAPHAKASAEGNNEGLQSVDGRSEKLHILLLFSGLYPAMKKPPRVGRQRPHLGTICPKVLYKSVWIVEIVIVEDVLVLFCERYVRIRHFSALIAIRRGSGDKTILSVVYTGKLLYN